MSQEDSTPFSLLHDTPEDMPIDYPALDASPDPQEAYDEGRDDLIDVDPCREDDDARKATGQGMATGTGSQECYTTSHDRIRHWVEYRYGKPARIVGSDDGLERGGLYITLEDTEPDIEVEPIDWPTFFDLFEQHNLAFVYRTRTRDGAQSNFYSFIDRVDVTRIMAARRLP